MFAARMTFAHFSVSAAMNVPNSDGVAGIGTMPRAARRAFTSGSVSAALISRLSLPTISLGVPAGAQPRGMGEGILLQRTRGFSLNGEKTRTSRGPLMVHDASFGR
jgi:hypothetical protein